MQCRTAEVLAIIFQLEGYSIFLGKLVKTHLGLFLKEYRSRLSFPVVYLDANLQSFSPVGPSFISISIVGHTDGTVQCEIMNSYHPKSASDQSGSGVGLRQVTRRLELLYPGRYEWEQGLRDSGKIFLSSLTIQTRER